MDTTATLPETHLNPNREISIRLRERYEFYYVALAFTILGLSIQTAHFDTFLVSDIAELSGWVALLFAGILGLARLQSAYVIFDVYGDIATLERERLDFVQMQQQDERHFRAFKGQCSDR